MKFSIQILFDTKDDKHSFRATAVYQTKAHDVGAAIKNAIAVFDGDPRNIKLGAIMPGHFDRFP